MYGWFGIGLRLCACLFLLRPVLVGVVALAGVGCSTATDPDDENETGMPIESFLSSPTNDISEPIFEDDLSAARTSLNQASFSVAQNALDVFGYTNDAIITWPLLGSLPLPILASAGTTAEQIETELSDFGSTKNLLGFRQLLSDADDNHAGAHYENYAWWQSGSRFNDDFLSLFDATTTPEHHVQNFRVSDSDSLVNSLVTPLCGSDCSTSFNDLDETRLLSASVLNHSSTFTNEGVTVEAFSGNFQYGNRISKNVPLLRLQGNLEQHHNETLLAQRITLPHAGLRLISIEPVQGHFEDVLENIENHMVELNELWSSSAESLVLPTVNMVTKRPKSELRYWSGLEEAYSEVHADLRNLDSRGGLYLQSGSMVSRVTLNQEALSLRASLVQTVTFSEINQPPPYFAGSEFTFTIPTLIPSCGPETLADLRERIFVIEDITSGLLMAVITFRWMDSSEKCDIDPFIIEAE